MRLIVMVGVSLIVLLVCYLAKIVSRAPVEKIKRLQGGSLPRGIFGHLLICGLSPNRT